MIGAGGALYDNVGVILKVLHYIYGHLFQIPPLKAMRFSTSMFLGSSEGEKKKPS